ncbi:MAG: hypothetical protein RBS43_04560 [Candidatus Cloacimonas sp.]|jgi:major membrane immunogen (membrane-anchored lipoprotein)|nr:hypothetical protein [Candidatus Cloacimonas sp.]
MKPWILAVIVLFLLLNACSVSKYSTNSVMKADYGTLRLVGKPTGRVVKLEGKVVLLNPKKQLNEVQLKSGTYNLEISSGGTVLLSQKLFIVNAQTNEVLMP